MGEGLGENDIIDRVEVIVIVDDACPDIVGVAVIDFIEKVAVAELLKERIFDREGKLVEVAAGEVVALLEGEAELDDMLDIVREFETVTEDDGQKVTEGVGRTVAVTVTD